MKTPIIIALSIVGVLGTAGAAMAVNAGTLAGFSQSNLGNAPTSLTTPTATPTPSDDATEHATPEAEPSEHATPEPGDDNTKTTTGTTTKSGSDDATEHSTAPSTVPSPSPTHHDDDSNDDHGGGGHGSDD